MYMCGWLPVAILFCCCFVQVPDVRFYKQTGDINKIPWSGLFGTGGYIAPEIMNQQPFGKPADLW